MSAAPEQPLAGRVAIITGASQGLGLAIAEAYLAAGASVALCARTSLDLEAEAQRLVAAYGAGRVVTEVADVAETSDIDGLFARTLSAFGRLDILVNNAGTYGPMGPIETVDWDAWVKAIAINLTGNVYCARKAAPIFKAQRSGKIIFLSGGGATNPLPGISAYAASKAAIVRFMETLAQELREWSIDVNAVAPGALMTRMMDELLAAGPARVTPALFERMAKLKTQGGTSLDIPASLCVYLASAASDGLTGRLISAPWDPWPFALAALADIGETDIYTLRRIVPKDRGRTWGDRE
jgi:3-oxoacyl-[acyl-carrier protein] reductase